MIAIFHRPPKWFSQVVLFSLGFFLIAIGNNNPVAGSPDDRSPKYSLYSARAGLLSAHIICCLLSE